MMELYSSLQMLIEDSQCCYIEYSEAIERAIGALGKIIVEAAKGEDPERNEVVLILT